MTRGLNGMSVYALFAAALFVGDVNAQQPSPQLVVVQAATQPTAATPAPAAPAVSDAAIATALKALEQVKAANDATLKKQEQMLQQLDELQKAAEQLKVFSKRV